MPCPDCGCTNPECENGCKLSKLDEIHAWLSELMPFARQAARLMEKRTRLMGWVPGARRED